MSSKKLAPNGPLFIGGGALSPDSEVLWRRLVDLAGGPYAKIAVMPTAATRPLQAGEWWVNHLKSVGCAAFLVSIFPRLEGIDVRADVGDPAIADQIKQATGIFFLGGEQGLITDSLLNPDGSHTGVLKAIFELWANGGVVGGSSAGAAIMSRDMFRRPPTVLDILRNGIEEGKNVVRGLGFLDPDWMVDQHFLTRGRLPRLLVAMEALGYRNGVGVDEDTAVIVQNGTMEVAGHRGALIVDLSRAHRNRAVKGFNLTGARITYLTPGDKYDMGTGRVLLRPEQSKMEDRESPDATDHAEKPWFHSDILGKNAVLDLLTNLAKSRRTEMISIASLMTQDAEEAEKGFAFRFYKDKESFSYYAKDKKDNHYTIGNIWLDVFPGAG